jgi:hypothetical protein
MAVALLFGSLNSGELSPLLDGRVDKEFYAAGAKTLENFIPTVQGPIVQRSGTGYVKEVKNSAQRTLLIPFQFNVEQAYALEFGDLYMRVLKDHAIVTLASTVITAVTNANPGVVTSNAHGLSNGDRVIVASVGGMIELNNREFTVAGATANTFQLSGVDTSAYGVYTAGGTVAKIYEIVSPYAAADLFDADGAPLLSYAQTADVMYIVHRGNDYAVRKLTRTGHTAWTLSTATFSNGPFAPMNGTDSARVLCDATSGTYQPGDPVTLQSNTAIFDANMVGMLFFMEELYEDPSPISKWAAGIAAPTTVGTKVLYDGNMYEVTGSNGTNFGTVAPTHTAGQAYDNPVIGTASYRRLRYLHSRWSIIRLTAFTDSKNMSGTIVTRLCEGLDPPGQAITNATNSGGLIRITSAAHDYSEGDYVTISGVGGVTAANGDWKAINVAANTFDLEGSVFAGVYTAGGTVKRFATWKWALGAFSASRGYPGAVAFYEERLALMQTAEEPDGWWLSESGSYDSFAQRSANQILATNSFRGTLANGQVNKIEWALSMDDGLVMGTAAGEYRLQAASTNEPIGPSNFRAPPISGHGSRGVQPVRVGTSAVFLQRAGKKLRDLGYDPDPQQRIGTDLTLRSEHLFQTSPVCAMAYVQEPDALLWCVQANGTLRAFTYQKEQSVYAWGRHPIAGYSDAGATAAPIVESVISIPAPDGSQNELWMVVRRYIDGGTKRTIEYLRPRWTPSSEENTPLLEDATMSDSGLTYDGAATSTLSGLWHLRGQTVAVLADGKRHPNVVVDNSGKITLQYQASVIQVGLPVRSRFKSMRLETLTQTGTAQGKQKVVNDVAVRVIDATNFRYGRNFTTMKRKEFTTQTQPLGSPVPLFSGDKVVDWPGEWGLDAFLCIENDMPVPFGIAAIFPRMEVARS